jgi:tripeptide aminopeptidase
LCRGLNHAKHIGTIEVFFQEELEMNIRKEVVERFLRYVKIDTQSQDGVEDRYPSTEKQLVLSRLLVDELKGLGVADAQVDKYGYVTGTLEQNIPKGQLAATSIPTVGLLAHVDTYHEVSGKDVEPVLHENYSGGPIVLAKAPDQTITVKDNPDLEKFIGDTIITSDGATLLGADDKAGIAEIMTLLALLQSDKSLCHPRIKVGFTPDEEVGNGTKFFDVKKFGAELAYTFDGGGMGAVEDETFCADTAVINFLGADVHPGYAKDKMINAVRLAAEFIKQFPPDTLPETTAGNQDYLHPFQLTGSVSKATLTVLVRSFSDQGLGKMERVLEQIKSDVIQKEPRAKIEIEIKSSYRNMKQVLDKHPHVVTFAEDAMRKVGLTPQRTAIRGGTDGARLSFEGLPTPNLSAGGFNFHSVSEWVPVGAMVKAVEMGRELLRIWVERGN